MRAMEDSLRPGIVGLLDYTLTDEEGQVLETTGGGRLLAYLHGHDNLPAPMEEVLTGLKEGDTFDTTLVAPFGEASGVEPQAVKRKDLPKDMRERLHVGMRFSSPGSSGEPVQLWVTKLKGAQVWLTTEHPLAGKNLRFQGTVARVREPSQAELEHGHAHGPGGHHH